MSPAGSNENHKPCSNIDIINGICSSASLKINKRSFSIKKSSPSSSSSSPSPSPPPPPTNGAKDSPKPPQRRPVIIYTHSPKIIHTNPEDFMALVQKLTGWSGPSNNDESKVKPEKEDSQEEKSTKVIGNEECEASSIIMNDKCNGIENVPLNSSYFVPPMLEPPRPYLMPHNVPMFSPNSTDFCSNQPYYNCIDPLVLAPPSIVPRTFPPYPNLPKSNNEFHNPRY